MSGDAIACRPVAIAGLGVYLPARRVTSDELDVAFGTTRGWVARATGVNERRYVDGESTEHMAAIAAARALADSGVAPSDVDLVIAAAASPRQLIPCTAVFVQRELGLPEGRSACFDVDATCLSWAVALDLVALMLIANRIRAALIVTSETASCSLDPREPETAGLFGDAAVATVVTRRPPESHSVVGHAHFETYSSGADLAEFVGAGTRHHPNAPNTRPEMNMFRMRGRALIKLAMRVMPPFLERFFEQADATPATFDAVVPHQASRLALLTLTEHFGFSTPQIVSNLSMRGNCIAASIPLALAEAVACGRIRRGDRLLLLGTGAGLTLGALDLVF